MGVDSLIRETVTTNLLRHAAGRAIFCPGCDKLLDWQDTVLASGATSCRACFAAACERIASDGQDLRRLLESADIDCSANIHLTDDETGIQYGAEILSVYGGTS